MAEKMSYKQLVKGTQELQREISRGSEAIRSKVVEFDDEAEDTSRVAEMIGQMRVDTATTSETRQLARLTKGLSEAAIAYASAGDKTARSARAAEEQARTTHEGIHERLHRAPVDNIWDLDPEWLRQE